MSNEQLTPLMKQFWTVKRKHPDKIILFRMGDFFETFFDDAKLASKILGITLTSRNTKDENAPSLAGFPHHALDAYLDKLVKAGQKVVIVEQMEDPKLAKGLVKREIVEIITPGAILDEKFLPDAKNNFLGSVYLPSSNNSKDKSGLALLDLSTGDFIFTELLLAGLKDELLRQKPKEILVENEESASIIQSFYLEYNFALTINQNWHYLLPDSIEIIKKKLQMNSLESIGALNKNSGILAIAGALAYVRELRHEELPHIVSIKYYSLDNYMVVDETTRRNLELFLSLRNNTKHGSLIGVLDETKTPMGSRLLYQWISYPLIDLAEILNRQTAVRDFKEKIAWTKDLRTILLTIGDLSRLISKLATLKVNPRDLLTLAAFLETAPLIVDLLHYFSSPLLINLRTSIQDYQEIINTIKGTLLSNPVFTITEGNIIQDGIHSELDELRLISKDGKNWIARLEDSEKKITGIPSLKVGFNKVFGYYIEITNIHQHKVPKNYICKQTLVNCQRYISPQLKEHEARVLGAEERIKSIEYEIFSELRRTLSQKVDCLINYVDIIAQIDVLATFGYLSWQNKYTCPTFNSLRLLELKDCRHPVIEKLLTEEQFIPNSVFLNHEDHRIAIITGPNMAGKSTYLRQISLCMIMAQIGCFIPCESANIPIFDRVFTRVGASDNLAQGQSTFLVEMIETANILNSATNNSLIILDEIGRGTSTFDGLSLAWAIVEYIHNTPQISAKTLFATHYHELTELENLLPSVKNYNVAVKEWNDQIVFIRKIERGCADQSYGIQVAKLAGIPKKIIVRAKEILKNLEAIEISPQGLTARIKKQLGNKNQTNLLDYLMEDSSQKDEKINKLKGMLMELEINTMSPMQAYQKLDELQKFILDS